VSICHQSFVTYNRAGDKYHLYETIIRQTVEACAILAPLPQSSISIVLQVCVSVPAGLPCTTVCVQMRVTSGDLSLQVVSSDGCMLACALNATCAVLMDAGIPMRSPFGARHTSSICR
jgi:ribonuclease PH